MKKDIHPKYHDCKVTCVCGNEFTTGSTLEAIKVEICQLCHPFYTGKQRLVDTAQRVEKFQAKMAKRTAVAAGKKGKKVKTAEAKAKKAAEQK
jgi:large subunit ribosomal protein L31